MKKLKITIVLFIIIIIIIIIIITLSAVCIYKVIISPFSKPQENFDTSFVKKIEISVYGQKFTFTDKKDVDYIKTFIEGKSYKKDERIENCLNIYHFDYLKLIGNFGINSLTLTPTGDDCGFYAVYGIFNKHRFNLRTYDLYPLIEFFEYKTNLKIIEKQFK